ncbi:histone demethylation 1 [Fusarium albosuccineum]|uniref:Histone demethylation 1 n=1 Tax=Fusarium albosuccineum TaxID=1237068 RepID=A0A8H4LDR1_9HYPO|nr:histone demethylation 1 [Fusarium albosuccineum]
MSKQFRCIYCWELIGKSNRRRHLDVVHYADATVTALIEKYLRNLKDHQSLLAGALELEIERAKGLRSLKDGKYQEACGLSKSDSAFLMDQLECWKQETTGQHVFEDIMHDFDKNKSQDAVFSTTESNHPEQETSIEEVIRQLFEPNTSRTVYAVNFTIRDAMFMPQRLQHHEISSQPRIMANVTPEGTVIDLHVDRGYHGITALKYGCIKIWGLYPWTSANKKLWEEHCQSPQRFVALQGKLEEGRFFVQLQTSAMYIPPGCIHMTVTIKGGFVPGMMYITHESLEAAADDLDIDISHGMPRKAADFEPFLESVIMCLKRGGDRRETALKTLCRLSKESGLRKNKLIDEVKKEVDAKDSCGVCGKKWAGHWRG